MNNAQSFPSFVDGLRRTQQPETRLANNDTPSSSRRTISATIVIPAYNEERNIARLIQQIVDEPWTDMAVLDDVIIVDDCSSDGTQAITERLACEYEQVRVIRHSERGGKNAGMRTGLNACRSDVVVFVDADVLLDPQCLVRTIRLLLDDPSLAATSCIIEPLPIRSWRERAPRFQALLLAEVSRRGHGSLARIFAIRAAAIADMVLPDDTYDDLYILRWLRNHGQRFAVLTDAVAYVRTASGLRDFAKQTIRLYIAGAALEKILPIDNAYVETVVPGRRKVLMQALAHTIRREPLGFVLYAIWRGITRLTPTKLWLPTVELSKYDTSMSTKDMGL